MLLRLSDQWNEEQFAPANFNNIIASYLTAKVSLPGNSQWNCNSRYENYGRRTTGKSKEQRKGTCFYRERGQFGGAVITKESIGGSWESTVRRFLIGWAATVSDWLGCTLTERFLLPGGLQSRQHLLIRDVGRSLFLLRVIDMHGGCVTVPLQVCPNSNFSRGFFN